MADRSRFGPRWDPDTDEVANPDPYDFPGAKRASARWSRDMTAAADFRARAARDAAAAEHDYRVALAKRIVELHDQDGVAWTVAQDVARGDAKVAELRQRRDVAEGMKEAAELLGWKTSGDGRRLDRLIDWSMRVAPDGQHEGG